MTCEILEPYRRSVRCPFCGSLNHRVITRGYVTSDGERVLHVRCLNCAKYSAWADTTPLYALRGYGARHSSAIPNARNIRRSM